MFWELSFQGGGVYIKVLMLRDLGKNKLQPFCTLYKLSIVTDDEGHADNREFAQPRPH